MSLFIEKDLRERAKQEVSKHPEGTSAVDILKKTASIDYKLRLENMRKRKAPDTPKEEWYEKLEHQAAEAIAAFKGASSNLSELIHQTDNGEQISFTSHPSYDKLGSEKEMVEITVKMPKGEGSECVLNVLEQIRLLGSWGTSREILIGETYGEDNNKVYPSFDKRNYFDGDGADRIDEILLNGEKWKPKEKIKQASAIEVLKQATPYSELNTAAKKTNSSPTESQIKAENYKKGKFKLEGLTIAIENPANSYREGESDDGVKWKSKMYHNYGYVLGSHGADGDHVDVFIKHNSDGSKEINTEKVFVINQMYKGKFDEHKCMIGFSSEKEAKAGYLKCYDKGWDGCGTIKEMSWAEFKKWVRDKKYTKKMAGEMRDRIRDERRKKSNKMTDTISTLKQAGIKHTLRNVAHKFNPKGIEKAEAKGAELLKDQQDAIKDLYKKTTTPNSRPVKQILVDAKNNRIKANKFNQNTQIAAGLSVPAIGTGASLYGGSKLMEEPNGVSVLKEAALPKRLMHEISDLSSVKKVREGLSKTPFKQTKENPEHDILTNAWFNHVNFLRGPQNNDVLVEGVMNNSSARNEAKDVISRLKSIA